MRMDDQANGGDKMKVDMSPEAVTARLRMMDELWVLSVKLMNSKKVKSSSVTTVENRREDIVDTNISLINEAFPKGT